MTRTKPGVGQARQQTPNGNRWFLGDPQIRPQRVEKYKQLVTGDPHFIGIMDAAKEGTGGVVVGKGDACVPTVFCYKCPQDIQNSMHTG